MLNISINEWIKYGMMTENQKETLLQGALNKKSIIILGEKHSGKTTLANTLMLELFSRNKRVFVLEYSEDKKIYRNHQFKEKNLYFGKSFYMVSRFKPDVIIIDDNPYEHILDKSRIIFSTDGITTLKINNLDDFFKMIDKFSKEQEILTVARPLPEGELGNLCYIVVITKENNIRKIELKKICGFEEGKYIIENIE